LEHECFSVSCGYSVSFGIYCHVAKSMSTDVSEVSAASIIRAMSEHSVERSHILWMFEIIHCPLRMMILIARIL
jgi:hypothetical protein